MINKLTSEQQTLLPVYRNKWIAKGLSTEPIDKKQLKSVVSWLYKLLNRKEPIIIVMNGPIHAWLATVLLAAQVREQVRDQVWAQVGDQVGAQVREQIGGPIWPYLWGQFDASYFSFYDFVKNVLNLPLSDNFNLYRQTTEVGIIYPLNQFCIVSKRLKTVTMNENGLHCESGPALSYDDGTEIWALNGVRVTKEIVLVAPDDIKPETILNEQNAEVRREIVRKVGIERLLMKLNSHVIDNLGLYDLILLNLNDGRKRPYLKMLNPSTGTWHIEGVPAECQTVEQAIAWRNGLTKYVEPIMLT